LTDLSLQYLAGGCHYLAELDISGCHLMTDKGLKYLNRGTRQLRKLTVFGCRGISRAAAQKIQAKCSSSAYSWDTPSLPMLNAYGVT
jgi:F-box/leucine-rich repeat protein 13